MKRAPQVTCRECGKKQSVRAARKNGSRCLSKTCHQQLCLHCGCTQSAACFVSQRQLLSPYPDFCYFLVPGVCSNPACITRAYEAITPEEVLRAQAYYEENPLYPNEPKPTLDDLREGALLNESELAHIIINELLREDYAYILSHLDIDVFDLLSGNYSDTTLPLISEIFGEWNSLIGRIFFVCGESPLTTNSESIYG